MDSCKLERIFLVRAVCASDAILLSVTAWYILVEGVKALWIH